MKEALNEQFGTAAEFEDTKGGMFLWVKLPDNVDTMKLFQPALAAGVAINPGPEWSVDKAHTKSRMRLCFAGPTHDEIRQGIAALAEVCHREFGVPARISNVTRGSRLPVDPGFLRAGGYPGKDALLPTGGGCAMATIADAGGNGSPRRALQQAGKLPEAEFRGAQHPARRGREGHRAQGVSGDGAGRLPGPQRRRAGQGPARADRQHRRMRAAQRPGPAPPPQHGGEFLLPQRPLRDFMGRQRRAQARPGAERHDLGAARREPQVPQHLRRGRPAAGDDRAGDRPADRSDLLRAEPRPRRSRTSTASRRWRACRRSASSSKSRWARSAASFERTARRSCHPRA